MSLRNRITIIDESQRALDSSPSVRRPPDNAAEQPGQTAARRGNAGGSLADKVRIVNQRVFAVFPSRKERERRDRLNSALSDYSLSVDMFESEDEAMESLDQLLEQDLQLAREEEVRLLVEEPVSAYVAHQKRVARDDTRRLKNEPGRTAKAKTGLQKCGRTRNVRASDAKHALAEMRAKFAGGDYAVTLFQQLLDG